jgi:hypothetical protein
MLKSGQVRTMFEIVLQKRVQLILQHLLPYFIKFDLEKCLIR